VSRECFARFRKAKAYPGLRYSFTTQIQDAFRITSMPNIWLFGFLGVIKRLELLENVLCIARIMSHNLCCLHENILHLRDRCQLIKLRKIPYICTKNQRELTHWISQQMVYIITTQQNTTYITHTRFLPVTLHLVIPYNQFSTPI
jgi:hypothetical protein